MSSLLQDLSSAIAGPLGQLRNVLAQIERLGNEDLTPERIAFFLLDPHPKMPNFPLSRSEAADLAT